MSTDLKTSGADQAIFLRFSLNTHAEERIAERTTMSPADVLEVLNTGRAVRLNDPAKHFERRAYYLFFSKRDKEHLVAVTRPTTQLHGSGIVVTVLTRGQYENDHGPLRSEALLSAGRRVLDPADYIAMREDVRRARADAGGLPWKRRDLNVQVHYWDGDCKAACQRVGPPRVPMKHLVDHGLAGVHRHPAFWSWLESKLTAAGLNLGLKLERIEVSAPGVGLIELDHHQPLVDQPAPFPDSELELTAEDSPTT